MRVVAFASLLFLAALSGCVSLVEDGAGAEGDALAQAEEAYDQYEAATGHISGQVRDQDGNAIVGALVDLVGIKDDVATDEKGRFAFLDLQPGVYTLSAQAPGFLASSSSIEVAAGQFARPDIVLVPDAPAPYYEVFHFEAFEQFGLLGFALQCYCDFEGEMAAEGLSEAVLEAQVMQSTSVLGQSDGFAWGLESWDASGDEAAYASGESAAPMREVLEPDAFAPGAVHWVLDLQPTGDLVTLQQAFDGYLTFFYNGPAPADYSAYTEDQP